jgi:DNA-binding transcriptional regulator YhcF (GntR family)
MKKHESFLYQEIAESLRRRIASGELKPGDKIPPVREMAQHWGCTPGTVVRAYAQLRDEGLLSSYRGGGTRVTPNALQPEKPAWDWANLVNRAEQFLLEAVSSGHTSAQAESALSVAISRWKDLQRADSAPSQIGAAGQATGLRFAGSHDLAIELMAQMLRDKKPSIELSIEYLGSLGGLMALAREEADVAGTHLWDEETDTYNLSFVRRLLPGRQAVLLTLAHRSLGLIVQPGNPQGLERLGDLARPDVRLVNRQVGSGTRVWLDAQLKALGISAETVSGYER